MGYKHLNLLQTYKVQLVGVNLPYNKSTTFLIQSKHQNQPLTTFLVQPCKESNTSRVIYKRNAIPSKKHTQNSIKKQIRNQRKAEFHG